MLSDEFHALIKTTAEAFRLGMEAQGSEGLVALIDVFPSLIKMIPDASTGRLPQVFSLMLAAQTRKDGLFLADLLEFQLAPLFSDKLEV